MRFEERGQEHKATRFSYKARNFLLNNIHYVYETYVQYQLSILVSFSVKVVRHFRTAMYDCIIRKEAHLVICSAFVCCDIEMRTVPLRILQLQRCIGLVQTADHPCDAPKIGIQIIYVQLSTMQLFHYRNVRPPIPYMCGGITFIWRTTFVEGVQTKMSVVYKNSIIRLIYMFS